MPKRFFILIFVLGMLQACSSPEIYQHQVVFQHQIWNRFHFIELEVPVETVDVPYDMLIDFVHTANYPSDHIAINFTVYFSNGGMRSRDYTFKLKDVDGKWTGEASANGFRSTLPFISAMQFPEAGIQRVRIESKMTKFDLPGVYSLDFKVRKSP